MTARIRFALYALLLAVVVIEAEHSDPQADAAAAVPSRPREFVPEARVALAGIDVARLGSRTGPKMPPSLPVPATPPASVPEAAAEPDPPPAAEPQVPPLPYSYVGQFRDADGRRIVYLSRHEELVIARPGTNLDASYRLEEDISRGLTITYIPVHRQWNIPTRTFRD